MKIEDFEDLKYDLGIFFSKFLMVFGFFFTLHDLLEYHGELAEKRHYCQMVNNDIWPAFKDGVNCNESSN